jgi:hypothetical protein
MTGLAVRLQAFFADHTTLSLTICDQDGPWAAGVFYVHDADFSLYFLTDPATRHGRNLVASGRAAATIHHDGQDWRRIKGVQMIGIAYLVGDALEQLRAWRLYLARFPFVSDFISEPGVFRAAYAAKMGKVRFFKLSPTRIWLTDNERQFGKRQVYDVLSRAEVADE